MIKRTLKMMALVILGIILLIVGGGALFMNLSPQFGGSPSAEDKVNYAKSGHFKKGKFLNTQPTSVSTGEKGMFASAMEFLKGGPNRRPESDISVMKVDSANIAENDSLTRITWFGHSAMLLEIDGKKVVIDPMLGEVPAPHPLLGGKRYNNEAPISIEKLPFIDVLLLSHDHYDHLDYGSIMKLKDKVGIFYVPLGVGVHLKSWDISSDKIKEFNWWDKIKHEDLLFALTPSRHFSGRGITDRAATLWGSWVIKGKSDNVYFSGDSGYGEHFKEIGEKYGPFDFAMMECGQYNEGWSEIHMMPEESAQAAVDVKTKLMMPIHWGTFTLSLHPWTDPVERVLAKAKELNMPITTPRIGEQIIVNQSSFPNTEWWTKVN